MYGANPSERETNLKKDVLNKILKIREQMVSDRSPKKYKYPIMSF